MTITAFIMLVLFQVVVLVAVIGFIAEATAKDTEYATRKIYLACAGVAVGAFFLSFWFYRLLF